MIFIRLISSQRFWKEESRLSITNTCAMAPGSTGKISLGTTVHLLTSNTMGREVGVVNFVDYKCMCHLEICSTRPKNRQIFGAIPEVWPWHVFAVISFWQAPAMSQHLYWSVFAFILAKILWWESWRAMRSHMLDGVSFHMVVWEMSPLWLIKHSISQINTLITTIVI